MRRALLTAKYTAPPPPIEIVIGGNSGEGSYQPLAGQYLFHPEPSGATVHLNDAGPDLESGSGILEVCIVADDFSIVAFADYDTGQGWPFFDIEIPPDHYVGVWFPTSSFFIPGGRGWYSPGGQTRPSSLGIGQAPGPMNFENIAPAIAGYGYYG